MRTATFIILALLAGGCASQTVVSPEQLDARYSPSATGALSFDPPVLAGEPRLDLSRGPRESSAFAGFEAPSATYYDIRTEDRQVEPNWQPSNVRGWYSGDQYERDAVSERVGVNYR